MARRRYSYGSQHDGKSGRWVIQDMGDKGYLLGDEPVVFEFPFHESHWDLDEPPPEVRAEYERLLKESGYTPEPVFNVVEMVAGEDSAFDQPCKYGHRVEGHAVYCHNSEWLYSPRKCRRTWYTGGKIRDEDCPGFAPNPLKLR